MAIHTKHLGQGICALSFGRSSTEGLSSGVVSAVGTILIQHMLVTSDDRAGLSPASSATLIETFYYCSLFIIMIMLKLALNTVAMISSIVIDGTMTRMYNRQYDVYDSDNDLIGYILCPNSRKIDADVPARLSQDGTAVCVTMLDGSKATFYLIRVTPS